MIVGNSPGVSGMAYYVLESELSVREDRHTEFKGHKNVAEKDVPPWCKIPNSHKSSQTAASKCVLEQTDAPARLHAFDAAVFASPTDLIHTLPRVLCGFLNTGEGGCVYMGVLDSGVVVGLEMTASLQQHLWQSAHDMMSRYSPPVSRERYTVCESSRRHCVCVSPRLWWEVCAVR